MERFLGTYYAAVETIVAASLQVGKWPCKVIRSVQCLVNLVVAAELFAFVIRQRFDISIKRPEPIDDSRTANISRFVLYLGDLRVTFPTPHLLPILNVRKALFQRAFVWYHIK